jgi:hypothetical protein
VSGTATSIGGPPVAMLYQHASGATLRSTMGLYFLVGNVLSGSALALAGEIGGREVLRALALLPFLLVGFLLSGPLRGRVDGGALRVAVLGLSAAGASSCWCAPCCRASTRCLPPDRPDPGRSTNP